MASKRKRIAVNVGGGYVPGIGSVVAGIVRAASELDWDVVGIRDGFDGLLFPERYPDGGLLDLSLSRLNDSGEGIITALGSGPRTDPFRVQVVTEENQISECDRSDELLSGIHANEIDAVISIVNRQPMSVVLRLHRKGLRTVCIPKSPENDLAATQLSFGFNSVLSFTVEMLESAKSAAASAHKIGVVEVPGEHTGWLALQAGIAVCCDAVLLPEIPYNLQSVAARLNAKAHNGNHHGLVVVAEGATSAVQHEAASEHALKKSLSPLASNEQGAGVIHGAGRVAHGVALELQRLTGHETFPLALGQLVKGGPLTAVDRQLGLAYGAAAVRALKGDRTGVMIAFVPPEIAFVPLKDAVNKVRTVPLNSFFFETARLLGIALGE